MAYILNPAGTKTKLQFFGLLCIFSVICSIVGVSLITIALCLPHTPYKTVENPIIDKIYREMGDFQTFYNRTSDENISRAEAKKIAEINRLSLEILRTNGTVVFKEEASFLFFRYFNGTAYQVNCECDGISLDLSLQRFKLEYQHNKENLITRIDGDFSEPYFSVHQLNFVEWPEAIVTQIWNNFVAYFNISLLYFSLLGSLAAIFIAFIILTARYLGLLVGGSRLNYFILKRLHGKIGHLLSKIPLIDFRGNWYLEEKFENTIDFSNTTKVFKEIFIERWYDSLVFPTALAAILINFLLVTITKDPLRIDLLYSSPLIAPFVILALLIYFPLIWSLDEGRYKQITVNPEGDIRSVKSLGTTIKKILGVIIGLSGIISLGSVALNLTGVAYETKFGSFTDIIKAFDIIGVFMLALWTLGLFLVLMSSILIGVGIIAIIYLNSYHLSTIKYLRDQSAQEKIIIRFGSITTNFSSIPSDIEYLIHDQ